MSFPDSVTEHLPTPASAQASCRVADHHGVAVHIVQHNGAHADNGTVADCEVFSYGGSETEVAFLSDLDLATQCGISGENRVRADVDIMCDMYIRLDERVFSYDGIARYRRVGKDRNPPPR